MFGIAEVARINLEVHKGLAQIESQKKKPTSLHLINLGLTTSPDQAFDPIVLVGKSAVNQPDNPLARPQP